MSLSIIFWNNHVNNNIDFSVKNEVGDAVIVYEASSLTQVLELLRRYRSIEMVLTSFHPSDLQTLCNIQHLQQTHPELALVAVVDTMLRITSVLQIIQRMVNQNLNRIQETPAPSYHVAALGINTKPVATAYTDTRVSTAPNRMTAGATGMSADDAVYNIDPSCRLTPRQIDVLYLIMRGKANKDIARILDLSEGTVKIHCMAIFRELGVNNRTQAAMRAEQLLPKLQPSWAQTPMSSYVG